MNDERIDYEKLIDYLIDCGFIVAEDMNLHLAQEHGALWRKINELENRLEKLEKKVKKK